MVGHPVSRHNSLSLTAYCTIPLGDPDLTIKVILDVPKIKLKRKMKIRDCANTILKIKKIKIFPLQRFQR